MRLSPFDERFNEAASHFGEAVEANPRFSTPRFFQAVSLALAGRSDEGQQAALQLLQLEPNFRSGYVFEVGYAPKLADKLSDGARVLGLPK